MQHLSFLTTALVLVCAAGLTKGTDGKSHCAEKAARIFLGNGRMTFLVGHRILGSTDKILCRALKSYNREDADADEEAIASVLSRKSKAFSELLGNGGGNTSRNLTRASIMTLARAAAAAAAGRATICLAANNASG